MKEIEYRVWHKTFKVMIPIGLINLEKKEFSSDFHNGWEGKASSHFEEGIDWFSYDVSHIELMEYTGIKDKNNEKIFEGDILKCEAQNYIGKVWFSHGSFMTDCEGFGNHPISQTNSDDFEKIGNIYQNSELLEV